MVISKGTASNFVNFSINDGENNLKQETQNQKRIIYAHGLLITVPN